MISTGRAMTTRLLGVSGDSNLPPEGVVQCTSLVPVSRALTTGNASEGAAPYRPKRLSGSSDQSGSDQVKYLSEGSVTRLSGGPRSTRNAAAQYWFYANMLNTSYSPQVSLYA
jgi:hypothetical protein